MSWDFIGIASKRERKRRGFLKAMINEEDAALFAESMCPSLLLSWHQGVSANGKQATWNKLKKVITIRVRWENLRLIWSAVKNGKYR